MPGLNKQDSTGAALAAGSILLVGGSVAASSLLDRYPVLGGQGVRYLAAGLLLAVWARLRHQRLPRPAGRDWAWLAGLAVIGLAGCSVLLIQATRVADPASVGVVIGAAPLVIVTMAALAAGRRPGRRVLLAAGVVTCGSAVAQVGGVGGVAWSGPGLLWSAGALAGVVGTSLLATPVLSRLGALAVTVYACGIAGGLLLAAAVVVRMAGGAPVLRPPTTTQLAALAYLAVAVTAVVFVAWYGAIERLGVDRTGLFNGLIPVTSLAAVALVGTGEVSPLQVLGALAVLAGVILGLAPKAPKAPKAQRPPGPPGPPRPPRPVRLLRPLKPFRPSRVRGQHDRRRAPGSPGTRRRQRAVCHAEKVERRCDGPGPPRSTPTHRQGRLRVNGGGHDRSGARRRGVAVPGEIHGS